MRLLVFCALVCVAAASPLAPAAAPTAAAPSTAGAKGKCAGLTAATTPAALSGFFHGFVPLGADALVAWKTDSYVYNDKAFSNFDGTPMKDKKMEFAMGPDLCKLMPKDFCMQDASTAFCNTADAKSLKLCCPLAGAADDGKAFKKREAKHFGGCPATSSVFGMPRAFMPQITPGKETDFVAHMKKTDAAFTLDFVADYDIGKLKPSQDEIFSKNSMSKVCTVDTATSPHAKITKAENKRAPPNPNPPLPPIICDDDYIWDGHHRWSQAKFCPLVEGCTPITKLWGVLKASWKCAKLIHHVQSELDYEGKSVYAGGSKSKAAINGALSFESFIELRTRFGRSAHTSSVEAGKAYVAAARAKLANMGLELKGGDQALQMLWEHRYSPALW